MQYVDIHPALAECLMWAIWATLFHSVCWLLTRSLAGY